MDRTSCNVYCHVNITPVVFSPSNEIIEIQYITCNNTVGYIGFVVPYGGYLQLTNNLKTNIAAIPIGGAARVLELATSESVKIKIVGDMQIYSTSASREILTLDETAPT